LQASRPETTILAARRDQHGVDDDDDAMKTSMLMITRVCWRVLVPGSCDRSYCWIFFRLSRYLIQQVPEGPRILCHNDWMTSLLRNHRSSDTRIILLSSDKRARQEKLICLAIAKNISSDTAHIYLLISCKDGRWSVHDCMTPPQFLILPD
jgi:hypothetical protein